jgi:hypothetical protein
MRGNTTIGCYVGGLGVGRHVCSSSDKELIG